ncbi:MAG: hypothetical protein ABSG68_21835 [Thermoguttaceae bacterium]
MLSFRPTLKLTMPTLTAVAWPSGTNTGSRWPSSKPVTGGNFPSLKIYNLAGMAVATRTSLMSSALRPGLAKPEATFKASSSEVERCVGRIASIASRSRRRSSVKVCSTRAVSQKLMTMATSPDRI